ncbi:30S ribosomal protein S4 [Candidatus Parcubacteria bacterium]|nr:30S ribosomal protein S4 [Patescibacteria group bacterium]MCG2693759.1 30S ribosomal protein S4 [Candidatus Parcubacteria bacterium]
MAKLYEQCKLCRREGEKLFLKGDRCFSTKCAIVKRNYKPGVHGPQVKPPKITDYGKQLRAKQAAKRSYGLTEKQFSNYIAKAMKKKENTADMILKFLESRLDNVVYRLGFTVSRASARQFVSHGFLNINGKKVDIPSYEARPGDIITINKTKVNKKLVNEVRERIKTKETPLWIALDKEKIEAKIISAPELHQGEKLFDVQNVIEFYSR